MFVGNVAKKAVRIRKTLRASTLSYTDDSVLLRMQHTALCKQQKIKKYVSVDYFHNRYTCLPMGSGLVIVVEKNPSHSRRP